MPILAPPTLTPAGLSPDRADRPTFVARSIARDDFIKNTQIPELQLALNNVYNNSQIAYESGLTVESAVAAQGAPVWVSGTTYALGAVVWSPITFVAYRRIVAGGGTTDPSADLTNWAAIITTVTAGGTGSSTATGARTSLGIKQLQSIDYTLSGNALTLKLNPTNRDYRSTTLTIGTPVNVSNTTQLTLTISSGSTMGTVSGVQSDIAIISINNAGTMELAAVNVAGGASLDETGLITTVAEGGAGAADSATVFYSNTARTGVAYRLEGIFRSTQTIAGTWAQTPTLVQPVGGQFVINPYVSTQSSGVVALPHATITSVLTFTAPRAGIVDVQLAAQFRGSSSSITSRTVYLYINGGFDALRSESQRETTPVANSDISIVTFLRISVSAGDVLSLRAEQFSSTSVANQLDSARMIVGYV